MIVAERGTDPWLQMPEVPLQGPRGRGPVLQGLLALAVSVGGPMARSSLIPDSRLWLILGVGVTATAILAALPEDSWLLRMLVPAAVATVMWMPEGELMAVWAAVGVGLSDWVVRRRRPLPSVPPSSRGALAPVLLLLAVAAIRGRDTDAGLGPLFFVGLAVAVAAAGAFAGDRLDRTAKVIGHAAGVAVSRVTFVLLGLLVIPLPWAVRRLLRVDPLDVPPGLSAWVPRLRLSVQPDQPWAREPGVVPASPGRRRRLALVAPTCLVVGVAVATGIWLLVTAEPDDGIPAAYAGASWYPEYVEDFDWIMQESVAWRPLHARRVADVRTRHVNVENGFRRTWSPPPCDGCPTVVVWVYGGSTTFGVGQRDEHTIASELARVAWEAGYRVEVENRGIPGHMHWTEAQRFAWDLTVDSPPDLVLFYDGVNELWGVQHLANEQLGDIDEPVEPLTEDVWRERRGGESPAVPKGPPGAELVEVPEVEPLDARQQGELAAERYDRSRKISRDTAAANEVPVVWFWQPSRLSRPRVAGEPFSGTDNEQYLREFYGGAESSVPTGVIDLTSVLDGVDGPLFSDDVHHNEVGSRVVAEGMWASVEAEVERLYSRTGGGG